MERMYHSYFLGADVVVERVGEVNQIHTPHDCVNGQLSEPADRRHERFVPPGILPSRFVPQRVP